MTPNSKQGVGVALMDALQQLDRTPLLREVGSFSFVTENGEKRIYTRVNAGWLQTWNGEIERSELGVKVIFLMAKQVTILGRV